MIQTTPQLVVYQRVSNKESSVITKKSKFFFHAPQLIFNKLLVASDRIEAKIPPSFYPHCGTQLATKIWECSCVLLSNM